VSPSDRSEQAAADSAADSAADRAEGAEEARREDDAHGNGRHVSVPKWVAGMMGSFAVLAAAGAFLTVVVVVLGIMIIIGQQKVIRNYQLQSAERLRQVEKAVKKVEERQP